MAGTYHGDFQFFDKLKKEIESIDKGSLVDFINKKMAGFDQDKVLSLLFVSDKSASQGAPKGFRSHQSLEKFKKEGTWHQPYY